MQNFYFIFLKKIKFKTRTNIYSTVEYYYSSKARTFKCSTVEYFSLWIYGTKLQK